jgi:hypothetical protein
MRLFRYKETHPTWVVNAEFTLIRDFRIMTRALAMSTRRDFRAMTRGAEQANPVAGICVAALTASGILGSLLLLSAP